MSPGRVHFSAASPTVREVTENMERYDWKATISSTILRMKILGLWPADDSYKFDLYTLWTAFSFILLTFGHNFFQAANLIYIFNDLEAITATLYVTLSEMLVIQKTYLVIKNMKLLKGLMVTLDSDLFQPRNERQIQLIEPDMKFWKLNNWIYCTVAVGAIFFRAIYPILDNSIQDSRLPFLAWYPYDITISPYYEISYIHQVCGFAFMVFMAVSCDTLIAALYTYIGTQFDILCDDIVHLYDPTSEASIDFNEKLLQCVQHHRAILEFAENCNIFSNWIIFGQFFVSAVSIGLTLFQLTVVDPLSSEFFSFLTFNIGIIVEIFVYCWFGNEVEVKSNKIPYAVFQSDWTPASALLKKHMIFFVERCQKPLKMSALNLFYLSLDTFKAILRASWSYFVLLHQLSSRR